MDTSFSYTDRDKGAFSSDEWKWINRIRKLKQEYPDEVRIDHEPEKNDGCICAMIPVSWFRIAPPRKVEMTEERKRALSEQMKSFTKTKCESIKKQSKRPVIGPGGINAQVRADRPFMAKNNG